MRIPPSAIVLPLILAVPFGLAIRDSVKGNDPVDQKARADKTALAAEAAEHDAEVAAEQAQYERTKKLETERAELVGGLIGSEVAAIGSSIATQQLGELPAAWAFPTLAPALARNVASHAVMPGIDGKLTGLQVELTSDACVAMRSRLIAAWGEGDVLGAETLVWIDRSHHRRASLAMCTLAFTRIVDEKAWVEAALPNGIIRGSLAHAKKIFGPMDGDVLTYFLPGLPTGDGPTELTIMANDRATVNHLEAALVVSPGEAATIVELLTKKLGPSTRDDGSTSRWSKTGTALTFDGSSLSLVRDTFFEEP